MEELVEEGLLVASGIFEELGDELLLIVPWLLVEVEVHLVDIKCIRLRLTVCVVLLRSSFNAGERAVEAFSFFSDRELQVLLHADRLGVHLRRLRFFDRLRLDVDGRRLDLLGLEPLVEASAQWTHRDISDIDVYILELTDHGLVFGVLNTSQWPQHTYLIFLLLVLVDLLHRRVMVLLVAEQDVVEERALARQKGAGDVERLYMPVLLLQLFLLLDLGLHEALPLLNNEAHLSGHAKVRDNQELKLLKEGLS